MYFNKIPTIIKQKTKDYLIVESMGKLYVLRFNHCVKPKNEILKEYLNINK